MLVVSRLLKVSAILRLQYIRAFRGMSLYPKTYVFWQSKKIKILEYSGTHFQNNLMRSVYLYSILLESLSYGELNYNVHKVLEIERVLLTRRSQI